MRRFQKEVKLGINIDDSSKYKSESLQLESDNELHILGNTTKHVNELDTKMVVGDAEMSVTGGLDLDEKFDTAGDLRKKWTQKGKDRVVCHQCKKEKYYKKSGGKLIVKKAIHLCA